MHSAVHFDLFERDWGPFWSTSRLKYDVGTRGKKERDSDDAGSRWEEPDCFGAVRLISSVRLYCFLSNVSQLSAVLHQLI